VIFVRPELGKASAEGRGMTAATQTGTPAADVLVETSRALPLVSFSIALKTGSILDPEGMSGATRMLTRWMRRTAGGRDSHVIDTEIDALGGAFGAGTFRPAPWCFRAP